MRAFADSLTLVQLHAPAEKRGRIIGVFSMAAMGSRMFSGFSVGILGQMVGIHWSLAVSAALILVLTTGLLTRRSGNTEEARIGVRSDQ